MAGPREETFESIMSRWAGIVDPEPYRDEWEGYDDFRTGLTFADVRRLLAIEQRKARDRGEYFFVSRSTVLGRWKELKESLWRGEDPPSRHIDCELCHNIVQLDDIYADCGNCLDCCQCVEHPEDDYWNSNPDGENLWRLT